MAMKMDFGETAVDNVLRQYNSQLSKAYRQLGEKHTVSSNLVNNAISIYGKENIRFTKDGIPQIKRNRATVNMYTNAMRLKSETQYTQGAYKGKYKSMYDVSRAYQKAISQVQQRARNNIPQDIMKIKNLKDRANEIVKYIKKQTTKANIDRVLKVNDMIAELYGKISGEQDFENDIAQALNEFDIDFRNIRYDADLNELEKMVTERYNQIYNPFNDAETIERGYRLDDYL